MDRRAFMWWAGLGAAASACSGSATRSTSSAAPRQPVRAPAFQLEEWTITQLGAAMASGALTARAITEQYLARIEAFDRRGITLRSINEINPDALQIADQLDRERRERGPRGPLHGIPILIKDNIDTADRMATTAGSLALAESIAAQDAGVVARLRAAGAVLLGKTNLSEWANFRSSRSTSGWSARGGQCANPYAPTRSPCGSSSGSGTAASANFCAASIGTETDGSIMCPASTTGLVGIKPTLGWVSRAGIIPISHTQDTAGPMARSVADAALLLQAIAGVDPRDPVTAASATHALDINASLDPRGLRGARIGVARKLFGGDDRVAAVMTEAIDVMKREGAVIIDPIELAESRRLGDAELVVMLYEFKAGLNSYLAGLGPNIKTRTLADVIAFNEQHRDRELAYFGQELFEMAENKGPLSTAEYVNALATCDRLARRDGIDAALARHKLDAILAPTGGPAWQIDLICGDHFGIASSTLPAVAGYPSITVPAGWVMGLPIGLSLFGAAWSEPVLVKLAFAYEQASRIRKPPALG
ncbi:MAG: amidase [Kofleriaceae bacterium]